MSPTEQLKKWIEAYYDRLIYLAYSNVKSEVVAQDIVQNSLIKAYRSIHQLKNPEHPYPWLVRIVINSCKDILKHQHVAELPAESIPEQATESVEDVYLKKSKKKEVYAALMSLPEKYRTTLILYYFEELTTKEIANVLNVRESTVRTQLMRGKQQLKCKLQDGENYEIG